VRSEGQGVKSTSVQESASASASSECQGVKVIRDTANIYYHQRVHDQPDFCPGAAGVSGLHSVLRDAQESMTFGLPKAQEVMKSLANRTHKQTIYTSSLAMEKVGLAMRPTDGDAYSSCCDRCSS
jgi:hypothetical protein